MMQGRGALAAAQFDSLLVLQVGLEPQFISAGLISLVMQNREKDATAIFAELSEDVKRKVCHSNTLQDAPFCTDFTVPEPTDTTLARELVGMYINDQAIRGNLLQDIIDRYGIEPDSMARLKVFSMVDGPNRERLSEIIANRGFPTLELVGRDAMRGVFLIIQHADQNPEWQKAQLPLVKAAVETDDMRGQDYAYLYDRIRVNAGLPQRYGTQFARVDLANGVAELAETEDPANLNDRRKEIGLMPIEMYRKLMLGIQ